MNPAILVVSFGTTHLDTLRETIARTETDIADAFPDWSFYRAFTSGVVRRRLREQHGIAADSVEDALARIAADGVTRVVVQPTLLIPGEEYERLQASVYAAAGGLEVSMGRPLLSSDQDLREILSALRDAYPVEEDTVLLAMGHGTEHSANDLYERLARMMREQTGPLMRLCTVEGVPTFQDAVSELTALDRRRALIVPLMLVAGDHAKNDMAGDEPDSLRCQLESAGYETSCVLQGLGQMKAVRRMYIQRALEAAEKLSATKSCSCR